MSIQDDIFDVDEALAGCPEKQAFARVMEHYLNMEQEHQDLLAADGDVEMLRCFSGFRGRIMTGEQLHARIKRGEELFTEDHGLVTPRVLHYQGGKLIGVFCRRGQNDYSFFVHVKDLLDPMTMLAKKAHAGRRGKRRMEI